MLWYRKTDVSFIRQNLIFDNDRVIYCQISLYNLNFDFKILPSSKDFTVITIFTEMEASKGKTSVF